MTDTDWWEVAYPGGKMVPVPGFPRSVYPPDAASKGKTPSTHGPDIEAYKRTVSRAGRWPWAKFDEAFSNGFSHGDGSGNVGGSGVAGIQRQQRIDDTGWIGEKTFNTLRSIKIPAGLPHAGEMAMDVTAQNLIAEAWTMFGGKPTSPPVEELSKIRERALAGAIKWIGTKENPRGSNHTQFGAWYGVDYQPWCAIFVTYCFEIEAGGSPSFERGSHYAYCPYVVSDARNNRNGLSVTTDPIPGDLVVYDWDRDLTYDHIGIFEKWIDRPRGRFNAIEGNTGASNYSNGGQVMRADRTLSGSQVTFVRVRET